MRQRSLSLWVSSCSESNKNESIVCSSEAQASIDYTSLTSYSSAMNSLWCLFSVSPKKIYALKEVQGTLLELDLALVRAGDTRWPSHYRAVKAGGSIPFSSEI